MRKWNKRKKQKGKRGHDDKDDACQEGLMQKERRSIGKSYKWCETLESEDEGKYIIGMDGE